MPISWSDPSVLACLQVREANLFNYNKTTEPDRITDELLKLCNRLNDLSVRELEMIAREDEDEEEEDGAFDALLDLGMRYYTGCTVTKNTKKAERLWTAVVDRFISSRGESPAEPNKHAAAAHSLLAHLHFEAFRTSKLESVFANAIINARGVVHHGMTTPTVLMIVNTMDQLGFRTQPPYNDALLAPLWKVLDDRKREMEAEERPRERKVRRRPNEYVCAKCGISAGSRTALRRCAGPCKVEDKPSYCSKECQVADWPDHKPDCKPGKKSSKASTSAAQAVPAGGTPRWEMFSSPLQTSSSESPSASSSAASGSASRAKSKEYRTVVPGPNGQSIEVVSRSMTAGAMREFRDEVRRLAEEDGQKDVVT